MYVEKYVGFFRMQHYLQEILQLPKKAVTGYQREPSSVNSGITGNQGRVVEKIWMLSAKGGSQSSLLKCIKVGTKLFVIRADMLNVVGFLTSSVLKSHLVFVPLQIVSFHYQ